MSQASAALAALSSTRSRTAPSSVLVPLTADELQVYRTASRNPLRDRKRKREDDASDNSPGKLPDELSEPPTKRPRDAALVVQHYNARPDVGIVQRQQSPIVGLRYFNNWVKSVLIARFAHPALKSAGGGKVLDMGCGKGGDLNKWQKAKVKEYFGLDIAAVSVDQARSRYLSSRPNPSRMHQPPFSATFATLDCYTSPLTAALPPHTLPPQAPPFDVVTMQFCMHYAFESETKARCMLDNVSRWMRRGGVFVGTIPNDELLLARLDALPPDQEELEFGNAVYKIRFDDREHRPTYGHRYWFYLTDAVENVPEYVVYWDNFIKLAAEYDLHPLYKAEFHDVFAEHNEHNEFKPLLERMHVVDKNGESQMDEEQWEASNVYIGFAFEKR
ncbi:guanine-N(7)-methyltransferase [Rickenella mellea]|uniref:mRNA cap guanine-N(7) methyltransferase n=1 Tax=Rickenella mellea TaxID=50990 RepID=A0A4Y7QIY7_9AGAM|nr:guanine-N(7)-methyltransferase [Rickenella mellea]